MGQFAEETTFWPSVGISSFLLAQVTLKETCHFHCSGSFISESHVGQKIIPSMKRLKDDVLGESFEYQNVSSELYFTHIVSLLAVFTLTEQCL